MAAWPSSRGHPSTVGQSPPLCEFQNIVGDADQSPLFGDLFGAAQQKLAKPAPLLDLTEDWLGQLFPQAIGGLMASSLDLLAHRIDAFASAFSLARVFGPPRRDIAVNPVFLQRREIGVRTITGVGRCLLRLLA